MIPLLLKANDFRASIFLLVLFLISINLRPALTSIAPVLERIVEDLSISRVSAGLIITIPVLLMGLLAPLAPVLARRWNQELVLTGTMALLVIAFCIRYFSRHSFTLLLISSLIAGSAIAIAGPLISGFIKQHFAKKTSLAIALYSISISFGAALAVALTSPIVEASNSHWEVGLAAWGVPALVALLVMLVLLPKSTPQQQSISNHQKLPLHSFRAWMITLLFAAQAGIFYALSTWLVAHYELIGFDSIKAGFFASVFMGSGVIGALVIPLIAARVSDRRKLMVCVTSITTLLLISITWQPQWQPIMVLSLLGISTSGTFCLALALPVLESDSPQEASQLSSMMSLFGYILGGVTPSLIGIGRDITLSFEWPFIFLTALSLSMVIISLFLPNNPKFNTNTNTNTNKE